MTDFIELFLTCKDQVEADEIAQALLDQHLVTCVKFESVHSKFRWKGKLDEADEVKLSMLSIAANFEQVEAEVARLHSYETFVLQATTISHLSKAAAKWLSQNTRGL
ncbi:MAG TPA: divalent cation tolerance protein CutA [Candidatus Saccharimonadales bacterium]|nr:divalent cation tolerance protein CutA [Candidatus Saccharimonadales bacterium]